MSVGYESYLVGLSVPMSTEYGDPSSDDLSSEWDTDDNEPAPVIKAINYILSIHMSLFKKKLYKG